MLTPGVNELEVRPISLRAVSKGCGETVEILGARHVRRAEMRHVVRIRLAVNHRAACGEKRRRKHGECAL